MPNYEFECNKCKENFELVLSMKDRGSAEIVCPKCKTNDVLQKFSGINIIIKSFAKKCPNGSCGGSGCCMY